LLHADANLISRASRGEFFWRLIRAQLCLTPSGRRRNLGL
jgi:hypothetical protein